MLELSAVDVELVQDNMEVLKKNGFEVGFEETPGADDDEAGQMVVTLRAQPVSKETVFDFSGACARRPPPFHFISPAC